MTELVLRWTVRLALCGYVVRLMSDLGLIRWRSSSAPMRLAWGIGSLLLLAHALFAFHVRHAWDHSRAYAEVARQTFEATGVNWGGGLYLNELTILLWLLDAAWCGFAGPSYAARPREIGAAMHQWLLFMAINGAIVFEAGPTRWVALAVLALLGGMVLRRRTAGKKEVGK